MLLGSSHVVPGRKGIERETFENVRRRCVVALVLLGALVAVAGSARRRSSRRRADARLDLHRREVGLGLARPDRPVAARPHRHDAGQRPASSTTTTRPRRTRGGVVGPRGDEPARDRQDAEGQQGGRARLRAAHRPGLRARSARRSRRPCRTRRSPSRSRRPTAASRPRCPRTPSRPAQGRRRRGRPEGHARAAADLGQRRSSSARRTCGRRSAARPRRRERRRRRHRHRHLARASVVREQRPAGAARRASYGCQFGDGSDVAHLGPTFACNNKLVGAYAFMAAPTWRASAPGANEYCNNATHICSAARLRGPRHAHRLDGRRRRASLARRSTASSAARSAAWRPGARVIMYRVCLAAGLLQLRLGRGRPAGDPRRGRRDQLLDLGRRATRTPTRSSSRSSMRSTRASPSTPRPVTPARARRRPITAARG